MGSIACNFLIDFYSHIACVNESNKSG